MSGFVVSLIGGILAVAAMAFDGSRLVAARATISDHAANAARAAAQEIVDVRLGSERIDPDQGRTSALRYLELHDLQGEVRISGLRAEVTIRQTVPMTLLTLIGVESRTLTVTRVAVMVDE